MAVGDCPVNAWNAAGPQSGTIVVPYNQLLKPCLGFRSKPAVGAARRFGFTAIARTRSICPRSDPSVLVLLVWSGRWSAPGS